MKSKTKNGKRFLSIVDLISVNKGEFMHSFCGYPQTYAQIISKIAPENEKDTWKNQPK